MEEKQYLDYQGLQTYHENLQAVLEDSEQATAEALDNLDDRLKIVEDKNPYSKSEIDDLLDPITDKLETIEEFAEVNIQSDWNQTDSNADDYIKNKPGIGVANGIASLDSTGKVPSSQLPSYVDDVIEGYYHDNKFYATYTPGEEEQEGTYSDEITPEQGKIYVDIPTNQSYRWSGSTYIVISSPYVLPIASANTLGGVKVGDNLSIDQNGVLSAQASSPDEVEIGHTTPTEDVKLFVDEDADPAVSIDVYTRAQTDTLLANKVDKVTGKGLSTNDFDNTSKNKLDDLPSTSEAAESGGTDLSLVTTGEKYNYEDKYTKVQIDALTRHTRLTDFDLNVLKQAVADQNLEKYGLKVGDEKTINGHTYVIAGLNPMRGTFTPYRVTTNHVGLIVIPHTTTKWNASGNTSTGADRRGAGYANCDLHYYLKNTVLPMCNTDLGAANLLAHTKLFTNAVNTTAINRFGEESGCSSGWGWVADQYISALSEIQVYGGTVWSSSGYDTGEAYRQLDVFQHYNYTEFFGENVWLRDVASASNAAIAHQRGAATQESASNLNYVAALILFH